MGRLVRVNETWSGPRVGFTYIFLTYGMPGTPTTTYSLVLLTGVPNTSPQLNFTGYDFSSVYRIQFTVANEYQVCGPVAHVDPICDGKIQITAFDEGVNFGAVHVETVVHTFLETQGEVFALLRQSETNDPTFRASVEFSDADIAISVVHKFNRATLGVRYHSPLHQITLTSVLAAGGSPDFDTLSVEWRDNDVSAGRGLQPSF